MVFLIVSLTTTIIILLTCLFFAYNSYERKGKPSLPKRKAKNYELLFSVFGLLLSVVALFYELLNYIPAPTIYPLDNEARVYSETEEIFMDTNPLLTTYYSLDGSDPKEGHIYEGAFTITQTATVSARNKFLFVFWSEISQRTYRFESIPIAYTYNNYSTTLSEGEITLIIFLIIIALAVLSRFVHKKD